MSNTGVESAFVRRLGAAARAAWWTWLIAVGIVTLQYLAYKVGMRREGFADWAACMMNTDTETLQRLFLHYIIAARAMIALGLLGCIFLSLWTRRLRRVGDA
jgi:hypothetical protein